MKISALFLALAAVISSTLPTTDALFLRKRGKIIGLQLVQAGTGTKYIDLKNGATFYLNNTTPALTVVAVADSGRVRKVQFDWNTKKNYRTEKTKPYALCGDKYLACTDLKAGAHTVTATVARSKKPYTISFTIAAGFAPGAPSAPSAVAPSAPKALAPTGPTGPAPTTPTGGGPAPTGGVAPTSGGVAPTSGGVAPTAPKAPVGGTGDAPKAAPTAPVVASPTAPKAAPTAPTVVVAPTVAAPKAPTTPDTAPSSPKAAAPVVAAPTVVVAPSAVAPAVIVAPSVTAPSVVAPSAVTAPSVTAPSVTAPMAVVAPVAPAPMAVAPVAPAPVAPVPVAPAPVSPPVLPPMTPPVLPPMAPPAPVMNPILIDCGSDQNYTDVYGRVWLSDRYYVGSTGDYDNSNAIDGTLLDTIYQSERNGEDFSYQIPVLATTSFYNVTLHFAEIWHDEPGKSKFNVTVEGTTIANIDIYRLAGGKDKPWTQSVAVQVSDGVLSIGLKTNFYNAKIFGIEIHQIVTSVGGPNPPVSSPILPPVGPPITATPMVIVNVTSFPLHIRAAGPNYNASDGTLWLSDDAFATVGGKPYSTNMPINGTVDDWLYQSERWGTFKYLIGVPNGNYKIVLHFAEIYPLHDGPGDREFYVKIESDDALLIDIHKAVGNFTAYTVETRTTVTDAVLTIEFDDKTENPKISGVAISQV